MDHTQSEPWCQGRFLEISQSIRTMLVERLGFEDSRVVIVPVSGLSGVNLAPSPKAVTAGGTAAAAAAAGGVPSWYQGLTLLEHIQNILPYSIETLAHTGAFRAVITSIDPASSSSKSFHVNAIILRGKVKNNRHIGLVGTSVCQIKKILDSKNNTSMECARCGSHVTLTLVDREGRSAVDMGVKPGDCLYKGSSLPVSPAPRLVTCFQAVVHTSPSIPTPILIGTMFELYSHGEVVECHISKIIKVESTTTHDLSNTTIEAFCTSTSAIKSKCKSIPVNTLSWVEITCKRSICLECVSDFEPFGRFVLRTLCKTVCVGLCIRIIK